MTDLEDDPIWAQMADFLCGPLVGHALLTELRARFPHAKRDDVYRAVALAWTHQQSGWLSDSIELADAQRALAKAARHPL